MPRATPDRRRFLRHSAATLSAACLLHPDRAPVYWKRRPHPAVVASSNGHPGCNAKAMELILKGVPVVEAVVAGVTLVENDPNDSSVGYGGIPNEEGVVELDASVMDGARCLAGGVAALRDIKNPAAVALHVLRYTDHCLLVGEGARRFALAHGFKHENLLTDRARKIWLRWKSRLSDDDDWFPTEGDEISEELKKVLGVHGTINCNAVDSKGDLAGVTTTSGLSFKIPGRVGDSPIIGAGLYVDNDAGAAGSTGRGEANIISCGSHTVVVAMQQGMHPKDACLYAAKNIVRLTKAKHLTKEDGRPNFDVKFYAVDKEGRTGGGSIFGGGRYAVFDKDGGRTVDLPGVFD